MSVHEAVHVDRPLVPKLDLGWFHRTAVALALIACAALGAFVALRTYAGAYVTFLETWGPLTNAYHAVFPVGWFRHLVIRDGYEKVYAGATLQMVVYYFAKKGWPRRPANWFEQNVERRLGVASAHVDSQGLLAILLSVVIWLPVYALPGMAIVAGILKLTGENTLHPAPWQITVTGLAGSFIMGRRVATGIAYHLQRIINRERMENGKTAPAWWMLWPMRWRFVWENRYRPPMHIWKHWRLQRYLHRATAVVIVLGLAWLTYVGWYALKYQGFSYSHPFAALGFHWGDLWQHALW